MRITSLKDLSQRTKYRSFQGINTKQQQSSLTKNDVIYQRNAVVTFKKPMKIGKKELLQILTKKNSVIEGSFALQNNKILVITETKQPQKQCQPASFRKKYMKTSFKTKYNQKISQNTIKDEIRVMQQKRQHINVDILKKYFAKNHLFNTERNIARQVNHLKGLKLVMNNSTLSETQSKDGQSWREERLEKRNRQISFVNNFMRTRYKTTHNEKEIQQTYRQSQNTHSMVDSEMHSDPRNKCLFEPWQKKEQYEQFQL